MLVSRQGSYRYPSPMSQTYSKLKSNLSIVYTADLSHMPHVQAFTIVSVCTVQVSPGPVSRFIALGQHLVQQ